MKQNNICDGRISSLGISMSGFLAYSTAFAVLNLQEELNIKLKACIPILSAANIFREGMFNLDIDVVRDELFDEYLNHNDPDGCNHILKLDLISRYCNFMWLTQKNKNGKFLGSKLLHAR